ncbi:MAG TPA: HAD-IA family hydrolase [Acidobacteriaceae bacterium]|nr:HAD-IA family hydrolase [Acidobacteriaceae bacterium]
MLSIANPIPAASIKLIVFDLDGTLIDSRRDLATAVNAMLTEMGRPALPEKVVAEYVGDGAGMLVRRALGDPEDEHLVDEGVERFLACYKRHMLDHTHVYDGVFEALEALRVIPSGAEAPLKNGDSVDGLKAVPFKGGAGGGERKFAVLTNKPVNPSKKICEALGMTKYFFQIYGGNSFGTKKPDAEGLRALMSEAGVRAEETVMVGDSVVDVLVARNAGTWVIGCLYGLSSHTLETVVSDCTVDAASEWPLALDAAGKQ